jgi:hypothetical protein
VGATVVAGYVLVFSASPDRAARAVPATAGAYVTVYLQPSAGQRMNLGSLLGRIPGFADPAALDGKIHEVTQRLVGRLGLDYAADLRPWLGDQLSVALLVGEEPAGGSVLLLASVREPDLARQGLARVAADWGEPTVEPYQGVDVVTTDGLAYAVLDDLAIVAFDGGPVRSALDAESGRAASLAGEAAFSAQMRKVPNDHLAAAYLDLGALARTIGVEVQLDGFATASLALVVEPDGLRVAGDAPFDADAATPEGREAFGLGEAPSGLADWMPVTTQAELSVLGLQQSFATLEAAIFATPELQQTADAITQLRALAALGLGINFDEDVLTLFDREAAVALTGLDAALAAGPDAGVLPSGVLLLRPADPSAAMASLERIRAGLALRGAASSTTTQGDVTITSVDVPTVISFAYAVDGEVIVAGLRAEEVAAAVRAHQDGETLAAGERYRAVWAMAGARAGNELFVDVGAIVDAMGDGLGVTGDERDILLQAGAFGLSVPSAGDHVEIHAGLSTR